MRTFEDGDYSLLRCMGSLIASGLAAASACVQAERPPVHVVMDLAAAVWEQLVDGHAHGPGMYARCLPKQLGPRAHRDKIKSSPLPWQGRGPRGTPPGVARINPHYLAWRSSGFSRHSELQ